MRFLHALSALALLAMLPACSVSPPDEPISDRPGSGVVEAVPPDESISVRPGTGVVEAVPPTQTPIETLAPVSTPTPAPKPPERTYRPGIGTVESASIVSLSSSQSAAAGGTTGPTMGYRLRMADGTMQGVVQTGERFAVGDRVEITPDGRLIRR